MKPEKKRVPLKRKAKPAHKPARKPQEPVHIVPPVLDPRDEQGHSVPLQEEG